LLGGQFGHVDLIEEWVVKNIFDTLLGTQSFMLVLVEQFDDEVLSIVRDVDFVFHGVGEVNRAGLDQVVHLMFVAVEEGRDTHDHLVDEDAEGPPIYGVVVPISDEHLGGQVLGRAAERVCHLAVLDELGETEVRHH